MQAAVAIGVKCNYCHAGKKKFTDKLEVATKMFKLAEMMDVKCDFLPCGKGCIYPSGKDCKNCYVITELGKNR